VVWS
jgi:hypothetical protein